MPPRRGKVAFVTGANGITGNAIIDHLIRKPESEWSKIIVTSRRVPAHMPWQDHRIRFIALDFLKPVEELVEKMAPHCHDVTHAFFASYVHTADFAKLKDLNIPLFHNFLVATDTVAGSSLQRVCLQTGGKSYGAHLGPCEVPLYEDMGRYEDHGENFYYEQEDFVASLAAKRNWDWNVIRPNAIIGFTPAGNGMSLALSMAIYMLCCREMGEVPMFPGNRFFYTKCIDDSSYAPSIADLSVWAATDEGAKNEDFSHSNGDVYTWESLWPQLGKYFGMDIPEFTEWKALGENQVMDNNFSMIDWAKDKEEVWARVVAKHGGQIEAFGWGTWDFFDWAIGKAWCTISTVSKARKFGWTRYDVTYDTFIETFRTFENAGILPYAEVKHPAEKPKKRIREHPGDAVARRAKRQIIALDNGDGKHRSGPNGLKNGEVGLFGNSVFAQALASPCLRIRSGPGKSMPPSIPEWSFRQGGHGASELVPINADGPGQVAAKLSVILLLDKDYADIMDKPQVDHVSDSEKAHKLDGVDAIPREARVEAGVLLTVDGAEGTSLRLAKDGHTVLLPQPTDDPNDPVNWSSTKKHLILFTVAWAALTADFASASGSAPIILQAMEWHESVGSVNQTNSISVLMMAIGVLVWVPLTSYIGRAPTLFWTTVFGLAFSIATALSPNFTTFYAMRAMSGLFLTSGQSIAVAFIKDIFFLHERARKIGLWAVLYIVSPYLGPQLSNFVVGSTLKWQDVFWLGVGVVVLDLIFIVVFLDETMYRRDIPLSGQPSRPQDVKSRMLRVTGIWAIQHHHSGYFETAYESFKRFFMTLTKPVVLLILSGYLLCFAWAIGINITTAILFALPQEIGGYGYTYYGLGYLYFSPTVGAILGEFFGHWFNDFLARRYVRKHKGVFEPEARLAMIYISAVFMIIGLVVLGQALHHHLSVAAVIIGWGMHGFGIMTTSVAVTAYVLDSYPSTPAEVSGWANFARAISGFSVGYFQQPWGAKVGYDASFGTQAAIVGASMIFVVITQRYGHVLRMKFGPIDSGKAM
ncbi:hypothetical protein FZEAL_7554 [Fusarium zealandicum]|uniref:Major facilitator superfamily (MFS) profile domain-containing protein n=1 Tax=Fusarium zealandicum TaxID=1053134 RepID=A0A8H4UG95_9HYPO|nr:hypothetical protein FZEAL_7554 [Fusarium zealandicum]